MAQVLLDLAALITKAAQTIDAVCRSQHVVFPSLDEPVDEKSDAMRNNEEVARALEIIVASADQIMVTAWSPARYMLDTSLSYHVVSALRVASVVNVAEVLREGGQMGIHVRQITSGTVVDPAKLGAWLHLRTSQIRPRQARVLRLLASRHIFREVSPDVFANNRLSSLLDTGKSVAELRAHPEHKFDSTISLAAIVEDATDDGFRASACLAEVLTDTATAMSDSSSESAMCVAHEIQEGGNYWTWLAEPAQAMHLRINSAAIQAFAHLMAGEEHIIQRFGWRDLPQDATVVDLGGGMGDVAICLSKTFPHLRLVVQDRPKTVQQGRDAYRSGSSEIVANRVQFQAHDFFAAQPCCIGQPSVYLLRFILHDWSETFAIRILRRLRDAAAASTKLVVVDRIIPYACEIAPRSSTSGRDLALRLPYRGAVKLNGYLVDIHMLTAFNGQERTLQQFEKLLMAAGWTLEQVHHNQDSASLMVATPYSVQKLHAAERCCYAHP